MSLQHLAHRHTHKETNSFCVQLSAITSSEQIYGKGESRLRKDNSQPANGILVVNNQGRMISLNRKFISMWNLSQEIISSQDDRQAIELVSTQFENPVSFLKQTRKIYEQVNLEIGDLIELKNGQVFERITKPQWLNGQIVGRIWLFRQIV